MGRVGEPQARDGRGGEGDPLVEDALVALERQVAELDRAVGAHPRDHLHHPRVDPIAALGAGDGHAVVAVAHEVHVGHPVDVDGRHRLPAPLGAGDPLEAPAHTAGGGAEGAVELLAAVDRPDDRVQRDGLDAQVVSETRPSAATTSSNGSISSTSPESRRSAAASRASVRWRRARRKSSWASAPGKPVLRAMSRCYRRGGGGKRPGPTRGAGPVGSRAARRRRPPCWRSCRCPAPSSRRRRRAAHGGGSIAAARPQRSTRQPSAQVPEPSTSPGCTQVPREA